MADALPAKPPVLPGFELLHILGRGGFADVFLYEQALPQRAVAVKVVHADLASSEDRRQFQTEANTMGRLSAHPNIVTVYAASVSDDGCPYVVMELCGTVVGDRYRDEPYSAKEALAIAIPIASALCAVHEAGLVHRDVKPANILTSTYGVPVLSDFGIAAGADEAQAPLTGVSVPWAAPEVLAERSSGSQAADIYSLGATIFALLTGRSPAELPHTANRREDLIERIRSGTLQRLPSSVPAPLREVVERALHLRPERRFESARDMLEALQAVQVELGYAPSPAPTRVEAWMPELQEADAEAVPARRAGSRRASARHGQSVPLAAQLDISDTSVPLQAPAAPKTQRGFGLVVAAVGVAALALIAGLGIVVSQLTGSIPVVANVQVDEGPESVEFSWEDPGLVGADSYLVRVEDGETIIQRGTTFAVPASPGAEVCVTVAVNRDGSTGEATRACGVAGR